MNIYFSLFFCDTVRTLTIKIVTFEDSLIGRGQKRTR